MTKFEDMELWEKQLRGSVVGFKGSVYADETSPEALYESYLKRKEVLKDQIRVDEAVKHKNLFLQVAKKILNN